MFMRFSKFKLVSKQKRIFTLSAGLLLGSALALSWKWNAWECKTTPEDATTEQTTMPPPSTATLPIYTKEVIRAHSTEATGIWVTYKDGVYDITEFVASHPGGAKILLAAGGAIDPFWALYAAHQKEEVCRGECDGFQFSGGNKE
jgi:cytochrome b involved in lipid metabolism